MEPLESPRVEQVGGILSRGEDTDGERTDDEVDFPSETSYVSRYAEGEDENEQQDSAEELEVTGEGTSGGPFGLKKVLFVRKKSEKGVSSKDEPSFKDRVSKLGAGVGERFAAFGSIIQEHGSKNVAASAAATSKVAENFSAADQTSETAQVSPRGSGAVGGPPPGDHHPHQGVMEYFREYELTFPAKPEFSLVPGPGGKGAVVSWDKDGGTAASPALAVTPTVASPGAVVAPETHGEPSVADAAAQIPPSGAAVIAVSGEPVGGMDVPVVAALLGVGGGGHGGGGVDHSSGAAGSREQEDAEAERFNDSGKLTVEVPSDPSGGGGDGKFPVVVRFREKMKRQSDAGTGGGEVFRNKMKAMATGLGNLFQGKDAGGGNAARDGSDGVAVAAIVPDAFVLTFSAGSSGTADELPFTMVESAGGLGIIVSAVREDYTGSLVTPDEAGLVSAATAGVVPSEVAAAAGIEDGGARGGLTPGAVVLRVAGQNVEGKDLERVRKAVETAAAEHSAVKFLFKRAPAIYRASVAAELALEQSKVPRVHVGTWQPLLKRRAGVTLGGGTVENGGGGGGGGVIGLGYGGEEWEDVQTTMARAHRFVNGFRSIGIRVDVLSMQTVTLPRNVKSAYAGVFEGRLSSAFQQAVRLWFSFPDERTVVIQRQPTLEKLGLLHVDTGGSGGGGGGGGGLGPWVAVTAADASPCSDAGVPVGEASILTHVNGFDVSPAAYRSLAPRAFGDGEGWAAAVLPALEIGGGDKISLTLV